MQSEVDLHPMERHGRSIGASLPAPRGFPVLAVIVFGAAAWIGAIAMIGMLRLAFSL